MKQRRHKFADGKLGDALDALFASGSGLDEAVNGRIANICRLLEQMPGSDSVQQMVHDQLDHLEGINQLSSVVGEVRKHLVTRKHSPGSG
jgi:hypothetical protein